MKPYFFQRVDELVSADVDKLFEVFRMHEMAETYLLVYHTHTRFPEVFTPELLERMASFSDERQKLRLLEELYPELSRAFTIKQMVAKLGDFRAVALDD